MVMVYLSCDGCFFVWKVEGGVLLVCVSLDGFCCCYVVVLVLFGWYEGVDDLEDWDEDVDDEYYLVVFVD